ncbi:MAG: hypothetical protein PWP39_152 [Pyrococcus sp.]|uniref:hypothetical protein n=1 Tax=Pyrococcus sp. TaxID=33866 RepID=UPI00258A14C6|nr:hypothetical protein [Pyrococcus sp.]MDK2868917.1 hypothetical protein [Pyrococcus sp.]
MLLQKKIKAIIIPILLIFLVSWNSVQSSPYWIRPGVYFIYTAKGDRSVIVECNNGTIYFGKYGIFRWEILDVSESSMLINVSLEVHNATAYTVRTLSLEEGLKRSKDLINRYSNLNYTKENSCRFAKTKNDENITICEDDKVVLVSIQAPNYIHGLYVDKKEGYAQETLISNIEVNLTRSALIEVSLPDNAVYFRGKKLGMNTLFLTDMNVSGKRILEEWVIEEVKPLNASVHTRFKTFKPPILLIRTNFYNNASNFALYDPSSGILLEGYTPVSPVWLALGFKHVIFAEKEHFQKTKQPITTSKDIYGFGMVLEETNAFKFEKQTLSGVEIPREGLIVLVISILSLLVVSYERFKANRLGKQ